MNFNQYAFYLTVCVDFRVWNIFDLYTVDI